MAGATGLRGGTRPEAGWSDYRGMPMSMFMSSRRPSGGRAPVAAIALLAFAPLTNCMCANVQRNRAYRHHLHAQLDRYVHAGARESVARDARAVAVEHGYALRDWDGREPATTEWRTTGHARTRERIELSARPTGHVVRFVEQVQHQAPPMWASHVRFRDAELERAVLERIHPGRSSPLARGEIASFQYDVAPAVLWSAVQDELSERGEWVRTYQVPIDATASTAWVVYEGDEPSRLRHELRIVPVARHLHRLEIHRRVERGVGPRRWQTDAESRDYDLELTLIRRRDAEAAAAMEQRARREGDEAFERAVDAGAVACGR